MPARRVTQRDRAEKRRDERESDHGAHFHIEAELALYAGEGKREPRPLDTRALLRYESRLNMLGAARIYFIIFGVLTIAGGIVGYVKAGSVISVIAGSVSGILLLVGAFILPEHHMAGLIIGLIVSLLLAAQFIPKFFRTGKVMPAGLMAVLSAIGIAVAIAAWLKD